MIQWFIYDADQEELARGLVTVQISKDGTVMPVVQLDKMAIHTSGVGERMMYVWGRSADFEDLLPNICGAMVHMKPSTLTRGETVTIEWVDMVLLQLFRAGSGAMA